MKILLLGKNGQVGWELQRALAPLGELVALDFDSPGPLVADFSKPESLAATMRAVGAGHHRQCGRPHRGRRCESEPDVARALNADAPAVLAREAAATGAWLLHYSTDYVFDGSGSDFRTEDAPTGPLSVYGRDQARRRGGDPRERLPPPDPAHQLGLRGARRQLREDDAEARRRARPALRHRRPDRRADRRRPAGRHQRACAAQPPAAGPRWPAPTTRSPPARRAGTPTRAT